MNCALAVIVLTKGDQIHFFAHLTVAQVISTESMAALLQSFAAVLDEFGVSYGRGKHAALCAAEGLMIVCFLPKPLAIPDGFSVGRRRNPEELVVQYDRNYCGYSDFQRAYWVV